MGDVLLTAQSGKLGSSEIVLISGDTPTGYTLHDWDLGNVAWELHWSGHRGTLGAVLAGATPQNRPFVVDLRVTGTSADDLAAKQSVLSILTDEMRRFGGRFTVRLKGATHRFHFDVKAGTQSIADYDWSHLNKHTVIHRIEAICAPYLLGDPMDVADDFSTDHLADYTRDAGASGDVVVTGGQLDAVANLTTEKRLVHTAYGYDYGDHQVTINATPGTVITSLKNGVIVKRTASDSYVEVYVDDNGTNSRLRIDIVTAGVHVNQASVNLAARMVAGTPLWIRGRIEHNTIKAEHFTAAPLPNTTPTTTASYTMTGADETNFGYTKVGKAGVTWTPQETSAKLDSFAVLAYAYRALEFPAKVTLRGKIPGDAPALCDVMVNPTADAVWALLAWADEPTLPIIAEAEGFSSLVGWTVTADANYRVGSGLKRTVAGAETLSAEWQFGFNKGDDYAGGELAVEVWARVELASTLVTPRLTASAVSGETGATFGYTAEYGSAGKALVLPSSGTQFRFVRLGVLFFRKGSAVNPKIKIVGTTAAGSTGQFGFDYLIVSLAQKRALGPTGKPNDASYPVFGGDPARVIYADLSGATRPSALPGDDPGPGLGGSLIELPSGAEISAVVKLSSLVPDDPTASAASESLSFTGAAQFAVTPRLHLARKD